MGTHLFGSPCITLRVLQALTEWFTTSFLRWLWLQGWSCSEVFYLRMQQQGRNAGR